jgi:hypothetical protein
VNADKAAATIEQFAGLELDAEAKAQIMAALEACARREQSLEAAWQRHPNMGFELEAEEGSEVYLPLPPGAREWQGTLEPPVQTEESVTLGGEDHWTLLGLEAPE